MTKELDGVTYTVLEDTQIKNYVFAIANKEWDKEDFEIHGDELQNMKWRLETVEVMNVKYGPQNPTDEDLNPRIETLLGLIEKKEAIPPLILREKDLLIFDGYARVNAFKQLNIKRCLAYVGY